MNICTREAEQAGRGLPGGGTGEHPAGSATAAVPGGFREGDPAAVLTERGFGYLEEEKLEEALLCFNRVIELRPDHPEAYNNAGYVQERMDCLAGALCLYRKALALDARNVEALINIAHIRDLEGDYHGALGSYQAAIAADPDSVNAHFCLAVLYDRYDMFDEAVDQYRQVLARAPRHGKALYNLSNLYIQMGEELAAVTVLTILLEQDPGHAEAWNSIGSLYEEQGRFDLALDAWRRCLGIDPLQTKANLNLARLQYALWTAGGGDDRKREIVERLKFVLALDPRCAQAKDLLQRLALSPPAP